jgi:molecular chaperone GrpE
MGREAGERMEQVGRPSSETAEASTAPGESVGEVERLRAALDNALRQAEEYRDLLRQSRLDLAEQRRKLEAERAEVAAQARVDLILRLLTLLDEPAPDHTEAAARQAEPSPVPDTTEQLLRGLLEAEGVEKIDALGALFNPWEHQALQHQTSPELDDQRVLAVLRDGYRLGDRVIRPAQVVVARRGV